jgi:hypothetical protein
VVVIRAESTGEMVVVSIRLNVTFFSTPLTQSGHNSTGTSKCADFLGKCYAILTIRTPALLASKCHAGTSANRQIAKCASDIFSWADMTSTHLCATGGAKDNAAMHSAVFIQQFSWNIDTCQTGRSSLPWLL